VEDVGACGSCGIDEQSVEEVTARCIERVHTTARFDHDIDVVAIGVVEDHVVDRRCVRSDHVWEDPPSGELQHATAHQPMSGHRVASTATVV
jgi:hypothetical protein